MSSPTPQLTDELIRAGAGAGKTTALVARVIDLVRHYRQTKGEWPRFVVTTFTRKATQELRERLTLKACQLGDLELLDYCRSRSRLHISTIHGVVGLFLRRYGHLLGLDPSYTILTETGADRLRRHVFRDVLMQSDETTRLLEVYSLAQVESMLFDYAEASSWRPDLRPLTAEDILKHQGEAALRWSRQLSELAREIPLVNDNPKWLIYAEKLQGLSAILQKSWSEETWSALMGFWDELPNKPAKNSKPTLPEELDERVGDARKQIKLWIDDPGHNPRLAPVLAELAVQFEALAKKFSQALRERKRLLGQLEMSDLELTALEAAREFPAFTEAFSSDWDHWFIDEFQDTSPVQVELLQRLVNRRPRYIVGDPQQSIYLFRGARSEVFAREEQSLIDKGLSPQLKLQNWRSKPSLLQFINDFFNSLDSGFQPMQPRNQDFTPGEVVATFFPCPLPEAGGKRQAEYAGLVSHIHGLVTKGVALSDICILSRKNKTLLEIAQFLKTLGYPTHVHASKGYSRRREVRDALALLKFLAHPADDENLIALLRSPWCRVSDDELVKARRRDGQIFWQQIQDSRLKDHPAILRLQETQAEAARTGLSYAWEKALVRFCFIDFSSLHDATGRREANLWKLIANLALAERRPGFQVLEFIQQSSAVQNDDEAADEGDAVTAVEPNVINLMTVHAAKGLQRPHVLIPHCDEQVKTPNRPYFSYDSESAEWAVAVKGEEEDGESLLHAPMARRLIQERGQRELDEQDRLLYVAVTRAQESVYLSWTGSPAPNSWAGRWRWPTTEVGLFERDQFRFEVVPPSEQQPAYKGAAASAAQVRAPWRSLNESPETPTSMSVTELLEGVSTGAPPEGPLDVVIRPEELSERIEKAVLGTDLHRLLEQARLNPDGDFSAMAQDWFPDQQTQVLKALEYVRQLQNPPMRELLRSGFPEWGFQVKAGPSIIEGQIDLWGDVDGTIWLIDYKSGNPRLVEKAFAQLEIYAMALGQFGHVQPKKLAVIYPFARQTHIRIFNEQSMKIPLSPPGL